MTNHGNARRIDYGRLKVFASSRARIACALLAMMTFIAGPAAAQSDDPQIMPAAFFQGQSAPQEQPNQAAQSQQPPAAEESEITVPAGTRLSLALFRSISFKHTKPGDPVHLQVVFPVTVGNRMVIPPGTYVQGVVDAIKRGNRKYEVLAMRLRWADIIFATGYTVSLSGPLDVDPTYGALSRPVSPRSKQVPVMADTGPPTLPPLPPLPSLGPSPAVITEHRFWLPGGSRGCRGDLVPQPRFPDGSRHSCRHHSHQSTSSGRQQRDCGGAAILRSPARNREPAKENAHLLDDWDSRLSVDAVPMSLLTESEW